MDTFLQELSISFYQSWFKFREMYKKKGILNSVILPKKEEIGYDKRYIFSGKETMYLFLTSFHL